MRIAVVHNLLNVRGGAERTMTILAKALKADFFTLLYDPAKTFEEVRELKVKALMGFRMPQNRAFYPWIFPFFNALGIERFLTLDLEDYDLAITSGNLALFAKARKTVHYCHAPARFLHDLRPKVLRYLEKTHGLKARLPATLWFRVWRRLDCWAARRPDLMVANSKQVRRRIRRYYGRDSIVVYPPVEVERFRWREPEDYFLAVQRPSPEKRTELLLEVFKRLPEEKLVLVGDYIDLDYKWRVERRVSKMPNVEWRRNVGERELVELYSRCKAVVETTENPDFGLVPVEAMASGKPVIAVDEGGFRETVVEGKTGLLVRRPYVKNLVEAIRGFDAGRFSPEVCRERARLFSKERFVREMKEIVDRLLEGPGEGA